MQLPSIADDRKAQRSLERLASQIPDGAIVHAGTFDGTVSTLGTVIGSVEVRDRDGTSLGFIPLYDAIT